MVLFQYLKWFWQRHISSFPVTLALRINTLSRGSAALIREKIPLPGLDGSRAGTACASEHLFHVYPVLLGRWKANKSPKPRGLCWCLHWDVGHGARLPTALGLLWEAAAPFHSDFSQQETCSEFIWIWAPQRHAQFIRRMDICRHVEYRWGGSLIKSRAVDTFPDHQPNVDVRRCWNISTISRHQEFKMWLFPASTAGSFLPVTEVLRGSHRTHHPCAWGKPRATGTNASNLNFVQRLFTFLQRTRRKLWI